MSAPTDSRFCIRCGAHRTPQTLHERHDAALAALDNLYQDADSKTWPTDTTTWLQREVDRLSAALQGHGWKLCGFHCYAGDGVQVGIVLGSRFLTLCDDGVLIGTDDDNLKLVVRMAGDLLALCGEDPDAELSVETRPA